MQFAPPLRKGTLIRRYKRFLADIIDENNETITIHCPNTGSMKNCAEPGSTVYYSTSDKPTRKYAHTWEIVSPKPHLLIGINTLKANKLVRDGIDNGTVKELQGFANIESEVRYGEENSRIDLLLSAPHETDQNQALSPLCYVEVKNLTLLMDTHFEAQPLKVQHQSFKPEKSSGKGLGLGVFPDAVTTRGHKHLRELMRIKNAGHRAVLFFCVQHTGINRVAPADNIDPVYGQLLREAANIGVEVLAYGCAITPFDITLEKPLPVLLNS